MESCIKKVSAVEGTDLDHYTIKKLSNCIIALSTVFENTLRSENLLNSCLKTLEKCKSRLFKEAKNEKKYKTLLKGVNEKLSKANVKTKIRL